MEYIKEFNNVIKNLDAPINIINNKSNLNDYTIHIEYDSCPIKIITNWSSYCILESPLNMYDLSIANTELIFKEINVNNILSVLVNLKQNNKIEQIIREDIWNIYQKIQEFNKYVVDYSNLESVGKKLVESKTNIGTIGKSIPKELLMNPNQIIKLIINEIQKVNKSRAYNHYIIPISPFEFKVRLIWSVDTEIGLVMSKIKDKYNYDYMEFKIKLDSKAYPFIPFHIEYMKPKIKLPLLFSLMNLDILKLENWNPTITIEHFIITLSKELEKYSSYIDIEASSNGNELIGYNDIEYELIKLANITKEINNNDNITIKIIAPKIKNFSNIKEHWNKGIGYGNNAREEWNIKEYIKEQELQKIEIANILNNLLVKINENSFEEIFNSILPNFIISQISGLNLLELEKSRIIYKSCFDILSEIIGFNRNQTFINNIGSKVKNIYEEIKIAFETNQTLLKDELFLQIYCCSEWYLSNYIEEIKNIIPTNIKEEYCEVMKKLQFGTYELPNYHRFVSYKSKKLEMKSKLRVLTEISSFKTGLPLNWESSIWVRVPKDNINLFSFIISGPKDTPYENGLFEFHSYFPVNYPNTEPKVLLHTTGNGTVRFNPNLYNCGKVCLSLLGTWSAQEGEKWNPKTSTFLQVLVSIQSLILVEQPYFNEPGYEREIGTPLGNKHNKEYNEERETATIQWAMIDMLQNPPQGFEQVVKEHFSRKKEEIIEQCMKWSVNSSKYSSKIKEQIVILKELLEKL